MSTITLARNVAMTAIPTAGLFTPGEAAVASYALKQLTTVGASATLVNGAVSAGDALTVDDATLLEVGTLYEWGAGGTVAEVVAVDPTTNWVQVTPSLTVADNATVKPVTLAAGTVSGLTYNTSTGVLSGTPDTLGSTLLLLYEMTDAAGLKAYSTPFDIVVATPPIAPSFAGLLNNEAFDFAESVSLNWSVGFTLADAYDLTGALPIGLSFDPTNAHVTGVVDQLGTFGPFTVTGSNGVAPDAQSNAITITVSAVVALGLLTSRPGMLLREFLLGEP